MLLVFAAASAHAATETYSINGSGIYRIDTTNSTSTLVYGGAPFPTGGTIPAANGQCADNNIFFADRNAGTPLYRFNPATPNIAPVNLGSTQAGLIRMSCHPTTGVLYAMTTAPGTLYTLNKTTGAATAITLDITVTGQPDPIAGSGDMGFTAAGTLYYVGDSDSAAGAAGVRLWTINLTTNDFVNVGAVTGLPAVANGISFTRAGAVRLSLTGETQLYTVAITGGAASAVTGGNMVAAMTDLSSVLVPDPDLSVTKTANIQGILPSTATPVTYTIVATNNTTYAVTATVTDTFPAGISGVTWTCAASAGSSCAAASGAGNIATTATLAASGTATYTVTATANSASAITNTATVALPFAYLTDATPANNTATHTLFIPPTVAKSFSPATIGTGGTSTLTVTLSNPNATAITGAAFTDTYPANLLNTATPGAATTCSGGTATAAANGTSLALSGGTIPASGSCTVTVTVTSAVAGSYLNSTGAVTTTNAGTGTAATATLTVTSAAPGSFNAFETSTTAGAITGVIKTKIAGSAFSLDVVAISGGAQMATFTNTVKVELLGNIVTGVGLDGNNCPLTFTLAQTVSPDPTITSGRSTVNFAAVSDAWKDVRVRISFPTTSPTVTSCSTNNFAIRPNAFASVSVSDQDRQTAGITRTLTNSGASGGNVHKAGQPFTLRATAVNAVAATTTNYADTPSPVLSVCVGTGCTTTFGSFSVGAAAVAGVINSTVASYSEVGAFALQLQDQAFASVDAADTAADCTAAGRYVCSPTFDVGRFVPDRFVLAGNNIPVLRTFDDATCTSRSFTYIGQPFGYVTAPQALVTAQNAAGDTTSNYRGSLWKLVASDLTQTYGYTLTPVSTPGLDTGLIGTPTVTSSNNGTGTATAGSGDRLTFTRSLTSPLAPFTANITLTTSVVDSSENGVAGNGTIVTATPALFNGGGGGIAFDSGNAFRYGRLRLANAHGWELLGLPVPMQAQHWNGTGFVTNTVDNCTTIAAANIAMGNYQGNLAACETAIAISGRLIAGNGNLTLLAPGAGNTGSVDLTVNLGTTVLGTTCLVVGGAGPADTPANLPHLRGAWSGTSYSENPSVRAGFGLREGSRRQIYRREVIGGN